MECWNHSTSNRMISATKDGKRYYITFIDDFSRYGYVYLIKHKLNTFEVFNRYQNKVENHLRRKIKLTPPRTPQLNGVAERRNRTLLDMVRSMMSRETLLISFWGYELETTAHILNLVPTKKVRRYLLRCGRKKVLFLGTSKSGVVRTSGIVSKPPQFYYGFHIEHDKISDSTLKGFENAKYPKRACKLQKAIYGLKQASHSWKICFHEKVTQFGFYRSEDEPCIYVKVSGSVVVILVLYADDILLVGNNIPTLQSVKDWLGKCFAMKDLGDAAYILCIKIYKDSKDLCLKTNEELDRMSRVPYASAVGSIMYAMTCIRPDVSFALSMVSRDQQMPGKGHWTTVMNFLKYLRNTKDRFLVYSGEEELRVTAVTWKISKQDTMADFTCESVYIAACEASKEAIWMKNFIGDLGVVPIVQDPIEIFCDNKKEEGHVIVKHIRSEDNPADPFTKALAKSRLDEHARSIGLKDNIKF
ncbi:retrotransposon protein, putative, ty1-copia subclass [Tanacetum coccineum]